MSTDYKVPYTKIVDVQPLANSDRLDIATVYGFQIVTGRGRYKVGDKTILVPIDSILPPNLEAKLFPAGSKIKLNKSRVRQIKIRGAASQGMLIDPEDISDLIDPVNLDDEEDLSGMLGITKYEPPTRGVNLMGVEGKVKVKVEHPLFHKYAGVDNIKWFPNKFTEKDTVVVQEKLHGTNARASVMPFIANTFFKKVKQFFGFAPKYVNCYGSNNVEISAKFTYKGFYGEDIYGKVFKELDVFNRVKPGEIVYGEIVGPGIQKGYTYGLTSHRFVLFDVKVLQPDGVTMKWLTPGEVVQYALERGFDLVPFLYSGPYNKEFVYGLTKGPSVFGPEKVREGVVIKAAGDYDVQGHKQALKWVSEDYLADSTNTDEH